MGCIGCFAFALSLSDGLGGTGAMRGVGATHGDNNEVLSRCGHETVGAMIGVSVDLRCDVERW